MYEKPITCLLQTLEAPKAPPPKRAKGARAVPVVEHGASRPMAPSPLDYPTAPAAALLAPSAASPGLDPQRHTQQNTLGPMVAAALQSPQQPLTAPPAVAASTFMTGQPPPHQPPAQHRPSTVTTYSTTSYGSPETGTKQMQQQQQQHLPVAAAQMAPAGNIAPWHQAQQYVPLLQQQQEVPEQHGNQYKNLFNQQQQPQPGLIQFLSSSAPGSASPMLQPPAPQGGGNSQNYVLSSSSGPGGGGGGQWMYIGTAPPSTAPPQRQGPWNVPPGSGQAVYQQQAAHQPRQPQSFGAYPSSSSSSGPMLAAPGSDLPPGPYHATNPQLSHQQRPSSYNQQQMQLPPQQQMQLPPQQQMQQWQQQPLSLPLQPVVGLASTVRSAESTPPQPMLPSSAPALASGREGSGSYNIGQGRMAVVSSAGRLLAEVQASWPPVPQSQQTSMMAAAPPAVAPPLVQPPGFTVQPQSVGGPRQWQQVPPTQRPAIYDQTVAQLQAMFPAAASGRRM